MSEKTFSWKLLGLERASKKSRLDSFANFENLINYYQKQLAHWTFFSKIRYLENHKHFVAQSAFERSYSYSMEFQIPFLSVVDRYGSNIDMDFSDII